MCSFSRMSTEPEPASSPPMPTTLAVDASKPRSNPGASLAQRSAVANSRLPQPARERSSRRQQLCRGHAALRLQHLRDRSLHLQHPHHPLPSQPGSVRLEVLHARGMGSCRRRLRRAALHLRNTGHFVPRAPHRSPAGPRRRDLHRGALPPSPARSNLLPHRTARRNPQRRLWPLGRLRARSI